MDFQAKKYSEFKGETFTADDILSEDPRVDIKDVEKFMRKLTKDLAEEGFTHIPYLNAVEDTKNLSYIMLVDRPKGKAQSFSPFAKKEAAFDDPDFMKAEGGVIGMKDKAINMNRGPRGIGPFAQYLETGGEVQPERNIFEEQAPKIVPAKTEAEALSEL